jgi:putative transcriptional regulator
MNIQPGCAAGRVAGAGREGRRRCGRHNGGVIPGSTPTKGRLLLATPPLEDPNFDRTVVYVLEHHDDGALGLILNRPMDERLGEPLDGWVQLQSDPSQIFAGGPVEPDALIALARTTGDVDDDDHLAPLTGEIASADLSADPVLMSSSISALRVFRGYSGWGPGQLDGEIEAGAWLVLDPEPGDLFTPEPDDLWRTVLRRQPGRLAWLADAPDDLNVN